jgi:hypothetical protein
VNGGRFKPGEVVWGRYGKCRVVAAKRMGGPAPYPTFDIYLVDWGGCGDCTWESDDDLRVVEP